MDMRARVRACAERLHGREDELSRQQRERLLAHGGEPEDAWVAHARAHVTCHMCMPVHTHEGTRAHAPPLSKPLPCGGVYVWLRLCAQTGRTSESHRSTKNETAEHGRACAGAWTCACACACCTCACTSTCTTCTCTCMHMPDGTCARDPLCDATGKHTRGRICISICRPAGATQQKRTPRLRTSSALRQVRSR